MRNLIASIVILLYSCNTNIEPSYADSYLKACVNYVKTYSENFNPTREPNKGIAINTAGIKPMRVLIIAVKVKAAIISLILIGAINKFVKFLLHISSRNIILKLILALNKKSYKMAAVRITPIVLL